MDIVYFPKYAVGFPLITNFMVWLTVAYGFRRVITMIAKVLHLALCQLSCPDGIIDLDSYWKVPYQFLTLNVLSANINRATNDSICIRHICVYINVTFAQTWFGLFPTKIATDVLISFSMSRPVPTDSAPPVESNGEANMILGSNWASM